MYTIDNFKNNSVPIDQSIELYLDEGTIVKAINVDFNAIDGNVFESLKELTQISILINSVFYTFDIISREAIDGYFFYLVDPVDIQATFTEGNPTTVRLKPSPGDANFSKSEYQAIQNNYSTNRSVSFIYDVDRTTSQITPSNYDSILNDTAIPAQYQELNYSSVGLSNSRYSGTKTSIEDYGVSSALGVKTFEGSSYLTSITDNYICSQSLNERELESFAYTGNTDFPVSGSRIFKFDGSRALPIRNRKIWVQENTRVLNTDGEGYISSSGSLCSI